eukprot:COSAG01_NODE_18399_length_1078_cov_1.516854_1_plen_82_part_10
MTVPTPTAASPPPLQHIFAGLGALGDGDLIDHLQIPEGVAAGEAFFCQLSVRAFLSVERGFLTAAGASRSPSSSPSTGTRPS